MKAIIVAAGRGSRLLSLTDEIPKCLVPFRGRPLIDGALESLRRGGVEAVTVVGGYRAERLEGRLASGAIDRLLVNEDWAETNMVQSALRAADWLEGGACLISYGDIFYSPAIVGALASETADVALAYDPAGADLWARRFEDPLSDIESFRLSPDGHVDEIGGRVRDLGSVQGQFMGLVRTTPSGWRSIRAVLNALEPARQRKIDTTSLLSAAIRAGVRIKAVPNHDPWGELDSPEDVAFFTERAQAAC
jgi:choline kinase